ncbi:MAG: hypothetical protein AB7S38_35165 [Vulcanimicrobiota bacterium]
MVTITDAKGNDTVFTVGSDGQVKLVTDPRQARVFLSKHGKGLSEQARQGSF